MTVREIFHEPRLVRSVRAHEGWPLVRTNHSDPDKVRPRARDDLRAANAASVVTAFKTSRRREVLSFSALAPSVRCKETGKFAPFSATFFRCPCSSAREGQPRG